MYSETTSRKHGLKKFFRNADAAAGACVVALVGGLLAANIGYALCVSLGLDEICKNGDFVLNKPMFWIGGIITVFFNLVAFAGLSCLISKINPKQRHGGVGLKFLAVVCCAILWIIYILVKTILAGHGWRSIWDLVFFYELCRGVWRWVVGVKHNKDSSCRPGTALSKVRSEPESERQNAKVVQTVNSVDVQISRREEGVDSSNDHISTGQEDVDIKAGYDQIRESLYGSASLDNSTTARTDVADKEKAKQMDRSLVCLAWSVIVVAIIMGIVIYSADPFSDSSAQHDKNEILEECKRVGARVDKDSSDASDIEQQQEDQKKKSIEELSKTVLWSENVFEEPIEMRKRKRTTDFGEVAEAMKLDKFWGVQLGSVVEKEGGILKYDAYSDETAKHRYGFTPRCWPGDLEYFYLSVTPKTHKVWRVGCSTSSLSLGEALNELTRLRKLFSCFKSNGEEYCESDGSWLIYPANTNRVINIFAEKSDVHDSYSVSAEAIDYELAEQLEKEGVQEKDDLKGLFGITLGDMAENYSWDRQGPTECTFTPLKKFYHFDMYKVLVSPRSATIYCIMASHSYQVAEEADSAFAEVLSILKLKYPCAVVKEQESGYRKDMVLYFRTEMEEPRCVLLRIDDGNTLYLSAVADDQFHEMRRRERFQEKVLRLKHAAEAL